MFKYQIYEGKNDSLEAEGTLVDDKIEGLFPDAEDPKIYVDGVLVSRLLDVEKIYWSYGDDLTMLTETDKYPHYVDLNLHVKTKGSQDGSEVKITFRREDDKPLFIVNKSSSDSEKSSPDEDKKIDDTKIYENVTVRGNETVFKNVLGKYKLYLDKDNMPVILAEEEHSGKQAAAKPVRPRWDDVFKGYPWTFDEENNCLDDTRAEKVFKNVLGDDYNKKYPGVFENACATRVSVGLLKSGMKLRKDFKVQAGGKYGKEGFAGEGFIASARGLKEWLADPKIWGEPDETIKTITGQNALTLVAEKINGRYGVYIILKEGNKDAKDHATLWIGADNDVIGKQNLLGNGGTVYFWELKKYVEIEEVLPEPEPEPEPEPIPCTPKKYSITIEGFGEAEDIRRATNIAIIDTMEIWALAIELKSHSSRFSFIRGEEGNTINRSYLENTFIDTTPKSQEITRMIVERTHRRTQNINVEEMGYNDVEVTNLSFFDSYTIIDGEKISLISGHNSNGSGFTEANTNEVLEKVIHRARNSGNIRTIRTQSIVPWRLKRKKTYKVKMIVEFTWDEPCSGN